MAIIINNATATPKKLPNSSSTSVTVTFDGQAVGASNVSVTVSITLSPATALSFAGGTADSTQFTFNSTSQKFSKTLTIKNSNNPASPVWLDGSLTVSGVDPAGDTDSSIAALVYQ
jgi:hypothetical protein